jgi:hypothetical protein
MTLDLSNHAHREALQWACERALDVAAGRVFVERFGRMGGKMLKVEATATISTPALAAEVLRGLSTAFGIATLDNGRGSPPSDTIQVWPHDTQRGTFWNERGGQWVMVGLPDVVRAIEMPKLPPLLLALLSIPLDAPDRREQALQALREAGR